MNAVPLMKWIEEVPPSFKARTAGGLYFFSLLTALFLELFLGGRLSHAADMIQIVGMFVVTLILYDIFKAVNRIPSLLAALINLAGITLEAIHLNPHGTDIAMVFHGIFCILIGYLVFKSTFLPRILGAMIAFGGLCWLTYFSPAIVDYLSPYNTVCGLLGEVSVFLWLLVMGVSERRLKKGANAVGTYGSIEQGKDSSLRLS
jgi:Domain of unknown function (DUF4386)